MSPSPCDQQSQQHQESQKDEDLKPCPPAWRRCFDSLHGWVIQPHTPHQHAFFWTGFALTVAAGALLFLWGELLVEIPDTLTTSFAQFPVSPLLSLTVIWTPIKEDPRDPHPAKHPAADVASGAHAGLPKFVDHVLRPGIHYIRVSCGCMNYGLSAGVSRFSCQVQRWQVILMACVCAYVAWPGSHLKSWLADTHPYDSSGRKPLRQSQQPAWPAAAWAFGCHGHSSDARRHPGQPACCVCRTGRQCLAWRLFLIVLLLATGHAVQCQPSVLPARCPAARRRSWAASWLDCSCCHSPVSGSCAALQVNYSKPQVIGIALAGLALLPAVLVPTTPLVWLLAAVLGFWPALATVTIGTFLGEALHALSWASGGSGTCWRELTAWPSGSRKAGQCCFQGRELLVQP